MPPPIIDHRIALPQAWQFALLYALEGGPAFGAELSAGGSDKPSFQLGRLPFDVLDHVPWVEQEDIRFVGVVLGVGVEGAHSQQNFVLFLHIIDCHWHAGHRVCALEPRNARVVGQERASLRGAVRSDEPILHSVRGGADLGGRRSVLDVAVGIHRGMARLRRGWN